MRKDQATSRCARASSSVTMKSWYEIVQSAQRLGADPRLPSVVRWSLLYDLDPRGCVAVGARARRADGGLQVYAMCRGRGSTSACRSRRSTSAPSARASASTAPASAASSRSTRATCCCCPTRPPRCMDPFTAVPTLSLICDVAQPGGQNAPYSRDPRYIARKAEEYLKPDRHRRHRLYRSRSRVLRLRRGALPLDHQRAGAVRG